MLIKVVRDLSNQEELSVSHLIGKTFEAEDYCGDYLIMFEGREWLLLQDEVESAECAYCDQPAIKHSMCSDCLRDRLLFDDEVEETA